MPVAVECPDLRGHHTLFNQFLSSQRCRVSVKIHHLRGRCHLSPSFAAYVECGISIEAASLCYACDQGRNIADAKIMLYC